MCIANLIQEASSCGGSRAISSSFMGKILFMDGMDGWMDGWMDGMRVCVVSEIKSKNHDKHLEMILSTALL